MSSFVLKLSPAGDSLIYATCLSNSVLGIDRGTAIAVDAAGSAYITGATDQTNFPAGPGPSQPKPSGGTDAYVVKLSPDGSTNNFAGTTKGGHPLIGRNQWNVSKRKRPMNTSFRSAQIRRIVWLWRKSLGARTQGNRMNGAHE